MAIMNPYNYKRPAAVTAGGNKPVDDLSLNSQANGQTAQKVKSDAYLEQKVMNARPEELTMMLYDGLVKFIKQAILFNEQKAFDKSSNSNLRAQAILQELRSSLNMDIEMSAGLEDLYLFMIQHLVDANVEKSNEKLEDVLTLATNFRDTWKEAMGL